MSSGKTHEKVGISIGSTISILLCYYQDFDIGVAFFIGQLFGNLLLSPDLDCKGAYRCKAWWRWQKLGLGRYWDWYSKTIPCHRHWLSHSVIISTWYRLLWLMLPFLLIWVLFPFDFQFEIKYIIGVYLYLGVEKSTIVHLILDKV